MLTTIEAEIDVNGDVKFLEPLKITKKSRAIVTLLDENVKETEMNDAKTRLAEERFARHFGAINSGDSTSADNEKIDADLMRSYEETHENE